MANARIYSERFLLGLRTNGGQSYEVPAGRRAVIRSLSLQTFSSGSGTLYLAVAGATLMAWSPGAKMDRHIDLRLVVYEGESIDLSCDGSLTCAWCCSGYLFDDSP